MVYFWRYVLITTVISTIHCMGYKRYNKIEKTQYIVEPNVKHDIKVPNSTEDVKRRSSINYADIPKTIADDILKRFANLTIKLKLNTGNNDTLINDFQSKPLLKDVYDYNSKETISQLPTLDYHNDFGYNNEFKPKLLKTKIKPMYETLIAQPELKLKFLDEAKRPQLNTFTRSIVINKNNHTIQNKNTGFKLKVTISKKDENNTKVNNDIETQYVIVNKDNNNPTKNEYSERKGEKKNDTEYLPKRNVSGFNIESKSNAHFKTNIEHKSEIEDVQFIPIQYHVPVLSQFQLNQASLPPVLPPRHTLPKFVPVYQSDDLPMHFHAPDLSRLDPILQDNSQLNQFHNLISYLKLRDSHQHSELKELANDKFNDEIVNKYLYQQYGISIPRGHSADEGPVKENPIRSIYTNIGDTRRGIFNKNEDFLDAHIKIPKNILRHYQPQIIENPQENIENNDKIDFIPQFSQIPGNVSYRKAEDLKAERDLQVTNSTNSLGIDTLIKQFLIDPGLGKEQTKNLFPKLISILGPEFSSYFGENPIPAEKIDNEIKKLQNTLETLRKLSEFSKNTTPTKTHGHTTKLPIENGTHLTESMSKESHLNNESQAPDISTSRYKITTIINNVTPKAHIMEIAEFLNTPNTVPKIAATYLDIDTTTKHVKTPTLKRDNKSYNPPQLELGDDSALIKKKTATFDEIKKSLDRFTMERKKIFTSSPIHLGIIPDVREEEEKVHTKEIQPNIIKDTVQNRIIIPPHLGLIGKVLNENYLLLSQQADKKQTASKLPMIIEIQGNDEDIIDPKYISENPEVFDSLRQQTEMMGKLLLDYKKHSARTKNKAHKKQSKDNNMEDFKALINKLEDKHVSTKHFNNKEDSSVLPIKTMNSAENSAKTVNSHEKSTNYKKFKHSNEDSTNTEKSSIELGVREIKHDQNKNSKEIATEKPTQEILSKETTGEEIAAEKSSKQITSKEISNSNEEPTKTLKNKTPVSRSNLKKALLRNPDLQKIIRYCKLQKRKNKSNKRNF